MPIFEFECQKCGNHFEELVRSSTNLKGVKCPECEGEDVRKKVSLFASKSPSGKSTSGWSVPSGSSCNTGSV